MRAAVVGFEYSFAVLFVVACGQEQSAATHASTYTAVLGPALGPELFLQEPRTLLPQRNSPSVALGPKGYLVASVDRLTAAVGGIDNSYVIGQYVQVTRLLPDMTVDGDVLRLWPAEPDERPLVTAVGDEFALVSGTKGIFLGFDGTLGATFPAGTAIGSDGNSLVVISPCATQTNCSLYRDPPLVARNVSRSGTRLKETVLEVSEGAGSHSLLWNGSEYLLVWSALMAVMHHTA